MGILDQGVILQKLHNVSGKLEPIISNFLFLVPYYATFPIIKIGDESQVR